MRSGLVTLGILWVLIVATWNTVEVDGFPMAGVADVVDLSRGEAVAQVEVSEGVEGRHTKAIMSDIRRDATDLAEVVENEAVKLALPENSDQQRLGGGAPDVDTSSKNVPKAGSAELSDKGKEEHDQAASNAFLSPSELVKAEENATSTKKIFTGPHAEIDEAIHSKHERTNSMIFGKTKERDMKLAQIKKDETDLAAGKAALVKHVATPKQWPHIPTPGVAAPVSFGSNTTAPTAAPTAAETAAPTAPTAAPTAAPTMQGELMKSDEQKKIDAAKGAGSVELGEGLDVTSPVETPLQEVANAHGGQTHKVMESEEEQLIRMDKGKPAAKLVADLDAFRSKAHEMRQKSRLAYVVHYRQLQKQGAFTKQNPQLKREDQKVMMQTIQHIMGNQALRNQRAKLAATSKIQASPVPQRHLRMQTARSLPKAKHRAAMPKRRQQKAGIAPHTLKTDLRESVAMPPDYPTGEVVAGRNNPSPAPKAKPAKATPQVPTAGHVTLVPTTETPAESPGTTLNGKISINFKTQSDLASNRTNGSNLLGEGKAEHKSAPDATEAKPGADSKLREQIKAAAKSHDYVRAGHLQAELSRRTKVEQEMETAAKAHDYVRAGHLQEELKKPKQPSKGNEARAKAQPTVEVKEQSAHQEANGGKVESPVVKEEKPAKEVVPVQQSMLGIQSERPPASEVLAAMAEFGSPDRR